MLQREINRACEKEKCLYKVFPLKKKSDKKKYLPNYFIVTWMKENHGLLCRLLTAIGLLTMILCLLTVSAFAKEVPDGEPFPTNVIEVPIGTEIFIDDCAGTAAITNKPADIM